MALPTVTFVSGGRVQVKPAGSHVSREQPSSQHGWPHHPPTEDVMMSDHAVNFPDIPSDVQMTLDEGAPSVPAQGTMFPEFNGMEWPHCVLSLGKGSDSKNKILFMRVNNNLYAYEGEKIDSVKCNLRLCIVPLVLVGKRPYGWAIQFEGGILGPIALFNTPDDICQLYMRVLKEPKDKAPCIQKVQDLITYLNLWKRCKLGSNEVINLALSEWKPPAWSSKKSCKRREALKEKGKAVSEQRPGPSSQTQSSMRTQPPCKAKGAKPSAGKSRGIPELPSNAPPLDSSVKAWRCWRYILPCVLLTLLVALLRIPTASFKRREFINKEQRHPCWGEDGKSTLMAMLPGVLGTLSRPDDSNAEADPPSLHNIQGKGMILVPPNWVEVSPVEAGQEYVNSIIANGGENNPQVMAKIKPLRKALAKPCPPSNVRLREWYKHQAQAIGCTINQVPPVFIYDLLHCPCGGASTVRGNPPEPKEGEMTDNLFKDEDRSQM
ncbi:hypothetical protein F5J12DRAFT_782003 [Pisolithus orientalis]|uniref:uncharacterized protein n=1 Tax=Pisolithus orientalis TaxID=936130 RepID=UPI0022252404|nr:uncharacterized protein F5J12DRAFT_782003 [Pisolithus orientalis]KAI6009464.1 hypothetical protein F5J12DRAFT_782003 [Pisolithus orientalis]